MNAPRATAREDYPRFRDPPFGVRALCVADEERIDPEEDEVIAWCAEHLARYKCPEKVMFVDEIPTGLAGKVLRRTLR